ncbi:hypothetical protein AB0K04_07155 [Micromonospora coxensis]|uniref:hypothetical protein n=1 Tax=Micromonospora coxensis TaxID=356852 RepID=UPI003445FBF3
MNERRGGDGEELDLTTIAGDDLLLDALGRGRRQPDGDEVGAMLVAWRDDLTTGTDDDRHDTPATECPAVPTRADTPTPDDTDTPEHPALPVRAGTRAPDGTDMPAAERPARPVRADSPAPDVTPAVAPARRRPLRRAGLRLAAAVVAALVVATGIGIGSRDAGPSSPLWSLTKVLHPERAQIRVIEDTIDRAREAVAAERFDEATQLIDQARRDLARVGDPAEADRLRADLDRLQAEIDAAQREASAPPCPAWPQCATAPPPSASRTPAPAPPGRTGTPTPRATAGQPPAAPSPSSPASPSSDGGILPPLPSLPLPTVLPSLPGLPLPSVDLPG